MNLFKDGVNLKGNYYSEEGELINICKPSWIDSAGNITITAGGDQIDEAGNLVYKGIFSGRFVDSSTVLGKWKQNKKDKGIDFILKELYPQGSLSFTFKSGQYNYKKLAKIEIEYPFLESVLQSSANDSINKFLSTVKLDNGSELNFSDIDKSINEFVLKYQNEVEKFASVTGRRYYESQFKGSILFNSEGIISFEKKYLIYKGDAYGYTLTTLRSYSIATGQEIKPDDLLTGNWQTMLTKMGEEKLKQKFNLTQGDKLSDNGFFGFKDGFFLTGNFAVTSSGLKFIYSENEIAPKSFGTIEIFFSFTEIESLIRDDSLLSFALD
ncbi:MAG: DUF4163 domain-containing protein [Ignavibacteriaceae bacterium]|nr:DUF4163 domain-containing protein [Ignavibacteriaceae bacterium]